MAWGMVFLTNAGNGLPGIGRKSWLFLILSGLATGASWLCYYTALKMGEASKVVPVDKLSVILTLVLAFVFLHEEFTVKFLIDTSYRHQQRPCSNKHTPASLKCANVQVCKRSVSNYQYQRQLILVLDIEYWRLAHLHTCKLAVDVRSRTNMRQERPSIWPLLGAAGRRTSLAADTATLPARTPLGASKSACSLRSRPRCGSA